MTVDLFGCSNNKRQIVEVTLSTEDAEAILAAASIGLPAAEVTMASGTTIKQFFAAKTLKKWSGDHSFYHKCIISLCINQYFIIISYFYISY